MKQSNLIQALRNISGIYIYIYFFLSPPYFIGCII